MNHKVGLRVSPHHLTTCLGLALVLGMAACSETAGRATPARPLPTEVSPSSVCPPSGLTATVGPTDAAMGLRVVGVVLTNCGTKQRRVKGYPVIKLFDKERRPLPITVKPGAVAMADPDPGPKSITLAPGKTAVAVLSWRNTVLADGSDVITGEYASLAVNSQEPARTEELLVDAGTTGRVAVTAWQSPRS